MGEPSWEIPIHRHYRGADRVERDKVASQLEARSAGKRPSIWPGFAIRGRVFGDN